MRVVRHDLYKELVDFVRRRDELSHDVGIASHEQLVQPAADGRGHIGVGAVPLHRREDEFVCADGWTHERSDERAVSSRHRFGKLARLGGGLALRCKN